MLRLESQAYSAAPGAASTGRGVRLSIGAVAVTAALVLTGAGASTAAADPLQAGDYFKAGEWGDFDGGGYAPPGIDSPRGIGLDAAGNVYVTDWQRDIAQKFGSDGSDLHVNWTTFDDTSGNLSTPWDIVVGEVGGDTVAYVRTGGEIKMYNVSDTPVTYLGAFGAGASALTRAPNGDIWTLSNNGLAVHHYSSTGDDLGGWSETIFHSYSPTIAVDGDNFVYLVSPGGNRVRKYSPFGVIAEEWGTGSAGSGPNEFNQPENIVRDTAGNLYIYEYGNQRVVILNPDGERLGTIPKTSGVYSYLSMAVAPDGSALYLGDSSTHLVSIYHRASSGAFTAGFASTATVGTAYSSAASASGTPEVTSFALSAGQLPNGLTLDANGTLSGTPSKAGSFVFTVQAENGVTPVGAEQYTINVAKAGTKAKLALAKTKVRTKDRARVAVRVTLPAVLTSTYPKLSVKIYDGSKPLVKVKLNASGTASVKLKKLAAGTHKLTVKVGASSRAHAKTSAVRKLKVTRS